MKFSSLVKHQQSVLCLQRFHRLDFCAAWYLLSPRMTKARPCLPLLLLYRKHCVSAVRCCAAYTAGPFQQWFPLQRALSTSLSVPNHTESWCVLWREHMLDQLLPWMSYSAVSCGLRINASTIPISKLSLTKNTHRTRLCIDYLTEEA